MLQSGMSDAVLDAPQVIGIPFTNDNASAMAKRSWETRRAQPKRALTEDERRIKTELAIVDEQIALTREALNDKTPFCKECERPALQPHHRAQLLNALNNLLDRRRILLGRPLPGTNKPAAPRRQVSGPVEPLD